MYTSKIKIDICSLEIISDPSHPWMVMIHGFGGTRHMWKRQVEQFKDCYNLMIVELPGHGDSEDGVSGHEDMNFTEIAKLLITHIHKKNIFKAHFLCVSLGSLIMSAIAELCPELVDSVLLCGAIFGMDSFGKFLLHSGNAIKHFFPYMLVIRMLATILMPKSSHKVSRKFLVMECEKLGRKDIPQMVFSALYGTEPLRRTYWSLYPHQYSGGYGRRRSYVSPSSPTDGGRKSPYQNLTDAAVRPCMQPAKMAGIQCDCRPIFPGRYPAESERTGTNPHNCDQRIKKSEEKTFSSLFFSLPAS